jgi:hypothetical protein
MCCAVLTALVILLIPIYRQRNERWVLPADLSTTVMTRLQLATAGYASGAIILLDDPSARFGLDSSFGPSVGDALRLTLGNGWTGEIRRAMPADLTTDTIEPTTRVVLALRDGQLTPVANGVRR